MTAYKTRGAPIVGTGLWEPGKGPGAPGWVVRASQNNIVSAGTVPISKNTYTKANQPQGDLVEVLSSDALDITQTVTVYGIDMDGNRVSEDIALDTTDGTTVMPGTTLFNYVESAKLDAACVGTVTVQEASGNADIGTITIGDLVMQIGHLFTGHLSAHLLYFDASVRSISGNVTFQLLWYPDDAGCVSGVGYQVIDTFVVLDTEGVVPAPHVYPVNITLPPGGYLAVQAVGEGGDDEDVYAVIMGIWWP